LGIYTHKNIKRALTPAEAPIKLKPILSIPKIEEKLGSDYKRGWGLKLIEELMDTVKFESTEEGTTVTMTKKK